MTDRHLPQDCIFVFPGPGGPDSDHSDDAVTWTSEALDMADIAIAIAQPAGGTVLGPGIIVNKRFHQNQ